MRQKLALAICKRQFVVRDGFFRTDDSAADLRLKVHPCQGLVVSCHSVPLLSVTGNLWSTLSHFDAKKHPLSDEEFDSFAKLCQQCEPLADL